MKAALYARAAVYARVSTLDQEPENQLQELRRYVAARGWTAQNTPTMASQARRTADPPSTASWRMPSGDGSMCWCAGVSTDWGGICAT